MEEVKLFHELKYTKEENHGIYDGKVVCFFHSSLEISSKCCNSCYDRLIAGFCKVTTFLAFFRVQVITIYNTIQTRILL